jgi:hypothetical protein
VDLVQREKMLRWLKWFKKVFLVGRQDVCPRIRAPSTRSKGDISLLLSVVNVTSENLR